MGERYSVATTANGANALDHLRAATALPDLILLDLHMPKMGGVEFLAVQRCDPSLRGVPVVVMTTALRALNRADLGVVAILYKPIETLNLLGTVARVCEAAGRRQRGRRVRSQH